MLLYSQRRNVAAQVAEELKMATYASYHSYGGMHTKKPKTKSLQRHNHSTASPQIITILIKRGVPYRKKGCSRCGSAGCRVVPAGVRPPGSAPPRSGGGGPRGTGRVACRPPMDEPGHHRPTPAPAGARLFATAEGKQSA